MIFLKKLMTVNCFLVLAVVLHAEEPKCPKNFQPYANRCIRQQMADYISCVEASGANKESLRTEVSNAHAGKFSAGAKGSEDEVVAGASGALVINGKAEQAIVKKVEARWFSDAMVQCRKVLSSTGAGGKVLSQGQQGGITAERVTITPPAPLSSQPHITWSRMPGVVAPTAKHATQFIVTTDRLMNGAQATIHCRTVKIKSGNAEIAGYGGTTGFYVPPIDDYTLGFNITSPSWSPEHPLVITIYHDEPDLGVCDITQVS